MSVAAHPLTWGDIQDWPEDPRRRVELVNGELVVSPSPLGPHQVCLTDLSFELGLFVRSGGLGRVVSGPIDVILAADLVFVPDLLFISRDRLEILGDRVQGPPDLCVEVISESNRTHDTVVKFQAYARHGVAEYWLVDLRDRVISSFRNADGAFELIGRAQAGERLPSVALPGLDLDPARVFPPA